MPMGFKPGDNAKWERKLNIVTGAGEYEKEDSNHSRYEPTSYGVLERLARSGYLSRDDTLVDYGCGKGRVSFFMNYVVGCSAIGVEYSESLYEDALKNLASYAGRKSGVSFVCRNAENYEVGEANNFYFFNPFSEKILRSVLQRIYESCYENPRQIRLFFYYALDSYVSLLMSEQELAYEGEIDCRDLFHNNDSREKIIIFRIDGESIF